MNGLLSFARVIDAFTDRIGALIQWIVTAMILIGFYNVLARYIGRYVGVNLTSNALLEIQWYLFSILFLLGFCYILRHNLNVRVDFLYTNWTPRRRALVDLIGTLIFLVPLCITAMLVAWGPVTASWGRLPNGTWGAWEVSPDPGGLPRAPIKTMIIVGFVLLLIQAVAQLIKYAAILTGTVSEEEAAQLEEYHAFEEVTVATTPTAAELSAPRSND